MTQENYGYGTVSTNDPEAVAKAVSILGQQTFPDFEAASVAPWFDRVADFFDGGLPGHQRMDTLYHDMEHTLQATLCFARLMTQRHRAGAHPMISARQFEIGIVAVLFHDLGYLKANGDNVGTGARFTHVHEERSAKMAEMCLQTYDWPADEIRAVRHMIQCTGPRAEIENIPFASPCERLLGLATCTADYIGQMSDPRYLGKLPGLYLEFEECDDFRGIPKAERQFQSDRDMLERTPRFWSEHVLPKLEETCEGLYHYLRDPYPTGPNRYVDSILHHLSQIGNNGYFSCDIVSEIQPWISASTELQAPLASSSRRTTPQ